MGQPFGQPIFRVQSSCVSDTAQSRVVGEWGSGGMGGVNREVDNLQLPITHCPLRGHCAREPVQLQQFLE